MVPSRFHGVSVELCIFLEGKKLNVVFWKLLVDLHESITDSARAALFPCVIQKEKEERNTLT